MQVITILQVSAHDNKMHTTIDAKSVSLFRPRYTIPLLRRARPERDIRYTSLEGTWPPSGGSGSVV